MIKKKMFIIILFFLSLFFGCLYASVDQGIVTLEIYGLGIRHGTPSNLNLGTIQYSNQLQEITGVFNNYFWVEDLLGSSTGHYTTVQCNGLYGPAGSIITGIYFKSRNPYPYLIIGMTGGVYISSGLNSFQSIYNPLVYIYKNNDMSNVGVINKYGDIPQIKVVIPPYTTPGTYNGTIIFSLYMN